jgi:hypothetical protein
MFPLAEANPFLNASERSLAESERRHIFMPKLTRLRLEPVRLPIVDVDFVVRVFNDPNTKKSLVGVRRQVVEKAMQILLQAKRNQIDGCIELDSKDVGLTLQALALTIEWQNALLFFRFENDDE